MSSVHQQIIEINTITKTLALRLENYVCFEWLQGVSYIGQGRSLKSSTIGKTPPPTAKYSVSVF